MALAKARIASIEKEVAKLDFANAKEVIADNDPNKTNLRHLRLTFEALDRLFALKSRNDIFKIDIDKKYLTRSDGATNNAEAFLGDAARNAFMAKQYLTMPGFDAPEALETEKVVKALEALDGILRVGMNAEQKEHYANEDAVWDSVESSFGFSTIPHLEKNEGDLSWIDFFNRTIRDQRFELLGALKGTLRPETEFYFDMRPEVRDSIELFGFKGKVLNLRPLGPLGKDLSGRPKVHQLGTVIINQKYQIPHIEKILLADEDKNALLENPTFVNDERLLNLIA